MSQFLTHCHAVCEQTANALRQLPRYVGSSKPLLVHCLCVKYHFHMHKYTLKFHRDTPNLFALNDPKYIVINTEYFEI